MKKINKISLLIAGIVFLIYILSFGSILGRVGDIISVVTMLSFSWFYNNGYENILALLDIQGFPLTIVIIMSAMFYIIPFVFLSILRFIYIGIKSLFSHN